MFVAHGHTTLVLLIVEILSTSRDFVFAFYRVYKACMGNPHSFITFKITTYATAVLISRRTINKVVVVPCVIRSDPPRPHNTRRCDHQFSFTTGWFTPKFLGINTPSKSLFAISVVEIVQSTAIDIVAAAARSSRVSTQSIATSQSPSMVEKESISKHPKNAYHL